MLDTTTRNDSDPDAMLADQATATLGMVTHRLSLSHRDRAKRFHAVLADIRALALSGCNEAECRLYETSVAALVDSLFAGKMATCERTARRMELEADTQEDHTQGTMAIEGETPATLELHARALDKQAAASRNLARIQRAKARAVAENRVTARQRFGLGGAA